MIWIDASVWLEIALDQDRAKACEEFIAITTGEKLFTSDFDTYSIILTMLKHKKTAQDIETFLGVLASQHNLTIFRPSALIMMHAINGMVKHKLTFDDSIAYSCMQHLGLKKIATLDQDFRKLDVEFAF